MKVGTDGVLLGAWANVREADRILDVGCGCGLIALMAAQRNRAAQVVGVELDAAAAADALANVQHSPLRQMSKSSVPTFCNMQQIVAWHSTAY